MTTDIVERLRAACIDWDWVGEVEEAIAEIERLRAEVEALRRDAEPPPGLLMSMAHPDEYPDAQRGIRKRTYCPDPSKQWGDTLAFARALLSASSNDELWSRWPIIWDDKYDELEERVKLLNALKP